MEYFYIKKFIRDDKETLTFDREELYLDNENTLLVRPDLDTTSIQYTGVDGGEMIAQRQTTITQPINGLIVPKTTDYWTLRSKLTGFFLPNHTYSIIYETIDGSQSKASGAWIVENLQVPPEPDEKYSRWTLTLEIGTAHIYEYEENEQGEEVYSNSVNVGLVGAGTGGQVWDSVGQEWDEIGQVWERGEGGLQPVTVESSATVYPVWTVTGEAEQPAIRNNSTDTEATYNGTIATGQTLVVDFSTGVATLDGLVVTRNLKGQLTLKPGENVIGFSTESGTTEQSNLKWNNIIQ